MQQIIQNIVFAGNIILPVFLIVAIGVFLKFKKMINDEFVSISSKVVFNVALPILIFMKVSQVDYSVNFDWYQILFLCSATIVVFVLTWVLGNYFIKDGKKLGSFVQGAMRSNIAIVGFAIIFNMSGDEGLAHGAILLSFVMPLYNVLSVIVLSITTHHEKDLDYKKIIGELIRNPLIISIIISLLFSYFSIEIPVLLERTGNYLTALTLPLALLAIGGSLNLSNLKKTSSISVTAASIKVIIIPLIFTFIAVKLGYRGMVLGNLFVILGCPTAVVSYIMAKAMGADDKIAGNIIVISTLASVITISIGLFLLKSFELI